MKEASTAPGLCRLQDLAGRVEPCPGVQCPFWEDGGAVIAPACLLARLPLDLERRPALVQGLLDLRLALDGPERMGDARHLFYRLRTSAED